jgi:aminobenzoyl-glutamate utilization protein B
MVQSMERLRAHQFNDAVIGHVLRVAGLMPSITCDEARLWITVRHENFERAEEVYRQIVPIAADAARYTHTDFSEQLISASRGYLANDRLGRVLQGNLDRIGAPAWDADELDFLAELSKACSPRMEVALDRDTALHTDGCDPFGQDDGEASWYIPLARVNWAQPLGVLFHNCATTAMSGHTSGIKGALMASEGLALTTVDLLADPAAIAESKSELAARVDGRKLSPPRCGAFELMTTAPETFWDASWLSGDRLAS